MNTAEQIYQAVQALPEPQAREVLDFVEFLKSRTPQVRRRQPGALKTEARILDPGWDSPDDDLIEGFYR